MKIFLSNMIIAALCVAAWPTSSPAQLYQDLYVINSPTAGILPDASYHLRGRTGPQSSFLVSARVGFRNRVQVGVSYGVQNVLGHGEPQYNNEIGLQVRLRILEEGRGPALAIGYDSQGYGVYHDDLGRYDRKSLGFYAVLSKNYSLIVGYFSLHGGVSISMEREDDQDLNPFFAFEWTVMKRLSFLLDTNTALNDNNSDGFGQGGVYMDGGVRLHLGQVVEMMLVFLDLTGNGPGGGVGREFELALTQHF